VAASDPAVVDAQVQAAIAAGEYTRALELLTQAYLDLVFGYCLRVLNADTSRAKDVTQQVFEEVCRGLARYRGEASVKTWLLAIAHHQCLKEIATCERRMSILREHQDELRPISAPTLRPWPSRPRSQRSGWHGSRGHSINSTPKIDRS
jgi:RNA polymerase sigma factor (sigma-70 family)